MNQYQDLDWARPRIKRRTKNNRKQGNGVSLSGLFSMLRKERHLSLIGDYQLMWVIVNVTKEKSSSKIRTALQRSVEYKSLSKRDKMQWLRSLSTD